MIEQQYVSAPEASWRLFYFHLHKEYPSHQRLQVHLEDEQLVFYQEQDTLENVVSNAADRETTLTYWIKASIMYPEAKTVLDPNFPENFVWNTSNKPTSSMRNLFQDAKSDDRMHKLESDNTIDSVLFKIRLRFFEHCFLELNRILLGQHDTDITTFSGFELLETDMRSGHDEHSNLPFLIREHMHFVSIAQSGPDDVDPSRFNDGQRLVYQTVVNAAAATEQQQLSNQNGGAVASSGTASLLSAGVRTSHSTFAIPLRVHESCMCSITPNSAIATLLKQTKLINWDADSMTSRHIFEAVDITFPDIARHVEPEFAKIPFGGRLMVFAGDFRQILPVIPREIEDGRAETLSVLPISDLTKSDFIKIPNYMIVPGKNLFDLLKELYPSIFTATPLTDPNLLTSSAILTTKNKDVTTINVLMLDAVPAEATTYYSSEKVQDAEQQIEVHAEFLNSIHTSSLPLHNLKLKVVVPIMLLRNTNQKRVLQWNALDYKVIVA
ncbi:hypothetical protein [Parasitella parasitica]|uniref:ATP-dependent DNA helicase n=1 Tax=Parasitella parasitica TaxID=35722 RepID=A0A0B7MU15_9FUNG|nr:hypothetical protein [Parasitella parasitica]